MAGWLASSLYMAEAEHLKTRIVPKSFNQKEYHSIQPLCNITALGYKIYMRILRISSAEYVQRCPTTLHALLLPMVAVTNDCMPASLILPAAEKGQVSTFQVPMGCTQVDATIWTSYSLRYI